MAQILIQGLEVPLWDEDVHDFEGDEDAESTRQDEEIEMQDYTNAMHAILAEEVAEEDTRLLLSWKVQSEVREETAALWRCMKHAPPSQPGTINRESPLAMLGYDILHHLLNSHLGVARLLYATSKQFQAVASLVLTEQVPRFLLTGSLQPEFQAFLGVFAQRQELVNGSPSYLSIHPGGEKVILFAVLMRHTPTPKWRWCVGEILGQWQMPAELGVGYGPSNADVVYGHAVSRDPDAGTQKRTCLEIDQKFYIDNVEDVTQADLIGGSYAAEMRILKSRPKAFHLVSPERRLTCKSSRFMGYGPPPLPTEHIRCLGLDKLEGESARAPLHVYLHGSTDNPRHQHALGCFTKLDELIHGYPVYANARGYRMWHVHNTWHVGPWEIDPEQTQTLDGSWAVSVGAHVASAWLHIKDSRFDPSDIVGHQLRAGAAFFWKVSNHPRVHPSIGPPICTVQCCNTVAFFQMLSRDFHAAQPVLALCGDTPGDTPGGTRDMLGKYFKATLTVNGYPYYINTRDPTVLLWRHWRQFAWTVGRTEQLEAGDFGPLVVVDTATMPERIMGMWQVLSDSGGVEDAPDLQIFLPNARGGRVRETY